MASMRSLSLDATCNVKDLNADVEQSGLLCKCCERINDCMALANMANKA